MHALALLGRHRVVLAGRAARDDPGDTAIEQKSITLVSVDRSSPSSASNGVTTGTYTPSKFNSVMAQRYHWHSPKRLAKCHQRDADAACNNADGLPRAQSLLVEHHRESTATAANCDAATETGPAAPLM